MRPNRNGRKMRLVYAGAGISMLAIPTTAVALTAGSASSATAESVPSRISGTHAAPTNKRPAARKPRVGRVTPPCRKLFTVKMAERAARRIYVGEKPVSEHELKLLGYIEYCQRNPATHGFVTGYDRRQGRLHSAHVAAARAAAAAQLRAAEQPSVQSGPPSGSESQPPTASQASSGGWALPSSVVQCESGGQNLGANSAGASGYYQIIPSTWQAHGGGQYAPSAYQATPQQQAAVASKIWNGGAGASQWTCAGQ